MSMIKGGSRKPLFVLDFRTPSRVAVDVIVKVMRGQRHKGEAITGFQG